MLKYLNPYNYYRHIKVKLKRRALLKRFRKVGSNFLFDINDKILTPELIEVGNDVYLGDGLYVTAEVSIGDRVMFGPEVMLIGGDHIFGIPGEHPRFIKPVNNENTKKIVIEEDVWIGCRVTVLKGVKIGCGAVIGAGSVVTKDIPPYSIAVGNPCKPVKKVFSDEELRTHLQLLKYPAGEIEKIIARRNEYWNRM